MSTRPTTRSKARPTSTGRAASRDAPPPSKRPRRVSATNSNSAKKRSPKKTARKSQTNRQRTSPDDWKRDYPWAVYELESDVAYCSLCRAYPKIAKTSDRLYRGCRSSGRYLVQTLLTHSKTKEHGFCVKRKAMDDGPQDPSCKLDVEDDERVKRLMTTAIFVKTHKWELRMFASLCELMNIQGIVIGKQYHNREVCKVLWENMDDVEHVELMSEEKKFRLLAAIEDAAELSANKELDSDDSDDSSNTGDDLFFWPWTWF